MKKETRAQKVTVAGTRDREESKAGQQKAEMLTG
jgi:hypothetical protein